MLAAIGVASVDEPSATSPQSPVRTPSRPGARLSEQEIVTHLTELAERNVDTGKELSSLAPAST